MKQTLLYFAGLATGAFLLSLLWWGDASWRSHQEKQLRGDLAREQAIPDLRDDLAQSEQRFAESERSAEDWQRAAEFFQSESANRAEIAETHLAALQESTATARELAKQLDYAQAQNARYRQENIELAEVVDQANRKRARRENRPAPAPVVVYAPENPAPAMVDTSRMEQQLRDIEDQMRKDRNDYLEDQNRERFMDWFND